MKLSKTATIAVTSASAIIYGFGVFAAQVSAQEANILSTEVSQQIQDALGAGDTDELLVDALSQVESQLREHNVSTFSPVDSDSSEIAELKNLRRSYIQQLRVRLQNLDPTQKQEFLQKIRSRRQQVRQELVQVRQEARTQRQQARQQRIETTQEELQQRRELFKANMEKRQELAQDRQKSAQEKFQDRLETRNQRLEDKNNRTPAEKMIEDRQESRARDQVKGAMDYQPTNLLERIGYWLSGK